MASRRHNQPLSPYHFAANNPVANVDPDGNDWYENKNGKLVYDESVSKDNWEASGIEGKYIGETVEKTLQDGSMYCGDKDGNIIITLNNSKLNNGENRIEGHYNDPLMRHADEAVSADYWQKQNDGLTRDEIVNQNPNQSDTPLNSQVGGPKLRYVFDPANGKVIDMRHMLVIGKKGSFIGFLVEVRQGQIGSSSAYDPQDFYSNSLGYNFYNNYENARNNWIARFFGLMPERKFSNRLLQYLKNENLRKNLMTGF